MLDLGKLLGLDKFEKALSRFDRPPLKVQESACFGMRSNELTCRLCLDVCPANAIEVLPTGCRVDQSTCVECGLCAAVCPAGAFELASGEEFLLANIKKCSEIRGAVAFCCARTKNVTDKRSRGLAVEMPCLGRLPYYAVVAAAAFGGRQIWMNDSQCAGCELGAGLDVARETTVKANTLLDAFGKKLEITYAKKPAKPFGSAGERPDLSEVGKFGRRDFLVGALKRAMLTGMDLAEDRLAAFDSTEPEVLPYRVSKQHQYFLTLTRRLDSVPAGRVSAEAAPTAQVKISDACSVCRGCAVVCPSKALVVDEGANGGAIKFSPAYCISCELCKKACPEEALSFDEVIEPVKLLSDKRETLVTFVHKQCRKCKQTFGSARAEDDTCVFCRRRAAKITDESWS